ncbi:MAG TPA: hypothetical protein VMF67_15750 [Rhizomicrobium sp.]|nr:hypothetical protein [Rhizomicrobium sp.]
MAATSMAYASQQHVKLPHGQTMQQLIRQPMLKKMPGAVFGTKTNAPIGVKFEGVVEKGAVGKQPMHLPKHAAVGNFSLSPNALFLSWFGWFGGAADIQYGPSTYSYCYSYSSGGKCVSGYYEKYSEKVNIKQSAAQPFTGAKKATGVSIGAEQYSGSGGATVGIYSGSTPTTKLASGSFSTAPAFTGLCCSGLETVTFKKPITLNKKNTYWVVVSGNPSAGSGRVAWNGQALNWTTYPAGEEYNETGSTVVNLTYLTYRSNYHETIHTTYHSGTGGWIHTSSFTYEEQPGAFQINQ